MEAHTDHTSWKPTHHGSPHRPYIMETHIMEAHTYHTSWQPTHHGSPHIMGSHTDHTSLKPTQPTHHGSPYSPHITEAHTSWNPTHHESPHRPHIMEAHTSCKPTQTSHHGCPHRAHIMKAHTAHTSWAPTQTCLLPVAAEATKLWVMASSLVGSPVITAQLRCSRNMSDSNCPWMTAWMTAHCL